LVFGGGIILDMESKWKVRCYLEYELDAASEEEAIDRIGFCIKQDLTNGDDIRDIAEVTAEKIEGTDKEVEEV
jgi:hypothetical protein